MKKKATKKAAKKKTKKKAAAAAARRPVAKRKDFGAPIDGFFAKQPATTRPILEKLREIVEEAAPEATASLKWGMPNYALDGKMMVALGGHKAHVNLILAGPPGSYADPDGLLEGEGKTGRHLKLTSMAAFPEKAVRAFVKQAVAIARGR